MVFLAAVLLLAASSPACLPSPLCLIVLLSEWDSGVGEDVVLGKEGE